jgi:hypothetical protein
MQGLASHTQARLTIDACACSSPLAHMHITKSSLPVMHQQTFAIRPAPNVTLMSRALSFSACIAASAHGPACCCHQLEPERHLVRHNELAQHAKRDVCNCTARLHDLVGTRRQADNGAAIRNTHVPNFSGHFARGDASMRLRSMSLVAGGHYSRVM